MPADSAWRDAQPGEGAPPFNKRREPGTAARTRAQSLKVRGPILAGLLKEPNVTGGRPGPEQGGGATSGASAGGR